MTNEPRRLAPVLTNMESLKLSLRDGEILLDKLLGHRVNIAHDCGGVLACTSCRVVIREGLEHLETPSNDELDLLDRADSMAPHERLACQVRGIGDVLVEIPRSEAPVHKIERPVAISPRAAKHLAAQLAKHPGAVAVRLAALPSGCSGFRYRVDPTDALRDGDKVFESGGVHIAVDATSLPYVQGVTLDVVDEGLSRRLRFDNPNARQTCGCGESFGV
jgi:iron-sulfur cluster assembly protein